MRPCEQLKSLWQSLILFVFICLVSESFCLSLFLVSVRVCYGDLDHFCFIFVFIYSKYVAFYSWLRLSFLPVSPRKQDYFGFVIVRYYNNQTLKNPEVHLSRFCET